jgi:hypothetical protein
MVTAAASEAPDGGAATTVVWHDAEIRAAAAEMAKRTQKVA